MSQIRLDKWLADAGSGNAKPGKKNIEKRTGPGQRRTGEKPETRISKENR